jgi:hypothetical protein
VQESDTAAESLAKSATTAAGAVAGIDAAEAVTATKAAHDAVVIETDNNTADNGADEPDAETDVETVAAAKTAAAAAAVAAEPKSAGGRAMSVTGSTAKRVRGAISVVRGGSLRTPAIQCFHGFCGDIGWVVPA